METEYRIEAGAGRARCGAPAEGGSGLASQGTPSIERNELSLTMTHFKIAHRLPRFMSAENCRQVG
jgi:hypothetical protein